MLGLACAGEAVERPPQILNDDGSREESLHDLLEHKSDLLHLALFIQFLPFPSCSLPASLCQAHERAMAMRVLLR